MLHVTAATSAILRQRTISRFSALTIGARVAVRENQLPQSVSNPYESSFSVRAFSVTVRVT